MYFVPSYNGPGVPVNRILLLILLHLVLSTLANEGLAMSPSRRPDLGAREANMHDEVLSNSFMFFWEDVVQK
jgi:hypothetical protein